MNKIIEAISQSGFKTIDLIILVIYLVLLVGLGLFLSRNKAGKEKSANDYFLAGNTLTLQQISLQSNLLACRAPDSAMV